MLKHLNAIENRVDRLIFLGREFKKDAYSHVISIFESISSKLGRGNANLTYNAQRAEIEFQFHGKSFVASIDSQLNYIIPGSSPSQIKTTHDLEQLELRLNYYLK